MNAKMDMTYLYGPYHKDDVPLYTHPQNLRCKSNQARQATLTRYDKAEQPKGEQEPFTVLVRKHSWLANQWEAAPRGFLDYGKQWADERINVYTHPQPKREPLTDEAKAVIDAARAAMDESTESYNGRGDVSIASELAAALSLRLDEYDRAIERAHGIGGEA